VAATDPDVLIVGAGSAGCVLAARFSADPSRQVTLVEAGALHVDDWPPELLDARLIPAAHPETWQYTSALTTQRTGYLHRGRVVGGSGAVNGGYFLRATPADIDGWGTMSYAQLLPAFIRSETDLDFDGPLHGRDGPLPVRRRTDLHPLSVAFLDACREAGLPEEPDKNAGSPPGVGPLPLNIRDGVRVNTALAYLIPVLTRRNLQVRAGTPVVRVLIEGGRATGVQLADGAVLRAERVVLCAGAIASAQLLMLSGVGPAGQLRRLGLPVHADLPVGQGFSDHPDVAVARADGADLGARRAPGLEVVLNTATVELRPYTAAFDQLVPGSRARAETYVGVALMQPDSRGELRLRSAEPADAPLIEHHYLTSAPDLDGLAHGVRLAHELLRLTDQPDVPAWVRANLGTSQHLVGTCALGPVVDERFCVLGVQGVQVVDSSVIPVVPSRGPHATVIALAEYAAILGGA